MPRTKESIEQDIIELRQRIDELEQETETAVPHALSIHSGGAPRASLGIGTVTFTAADGLDIQAVRDGSRVDGWWNGTATRQLRDYLNAHFPVDA